MVEHDFMVFDSALPAKINSKWRRRSHVAKTLHRLTNGFYEFSDNVERPVVKTGTTENKIDRFCLYINHVLF